MEDILEIPDTIEENELLSAIWTRPSHALYFIIKKYPNKHVNTIIHLSVLVSIVNACLGTLSHYFILSVISIIPITIVVWLMTWLFVYIYASALSWTGGWIGGAGDMDQFLTLIAWSLLPCFFTIIPSILEQIAFDKKLEYVDLDGQNLTTTILYYFIRIIKDGLYIWSFIILVKGTMILQKFGIWKALINVLLSALVILIAVGVIVGFIYII